MMRIQRSATSHIFRLLTPCLGRKTTTANSLQAPSQSLIPCSRSHDFRILAQIMAAGSVEDPKSVAEIRSKLESGLHDVVEAPCLLQVDYSGVYVHKDGLNQNLVQSLAGDVVWEKEKLLNNKLKAHGYGDYDLTIGFINTKYFESREKFDSLFSNLWSFPDEQTGALVPVKAVDTISLEQALATFDITLACDMESYQSSQNDLGHKVQELDVDDKSSLKLAERRLFCREMAEIFGEQSVEEETIPATYFNDFRVLYSDGNDIYASAVRGEHYFIFNYGTS